MKLNRNRGFTLIELLVVIAIIGILSGIVLVSLNSSKAKARDGKKVSDLAQIQLALEQYFDRCKQYPASVDVTANSGCTGSISLGSFISKIPVPSSGNYDYATCQVGGSASGNPVLDYVLHATLENANSSPGGLSIFPPSCTSTGGSWTTLAAWDKTTHGCSIAGEYCVGSK